jgi:PAS domain S-box-containing protein
MKDTTTTSTQDNSPFKIFDGLLELALVVNDQYEIIYINDSAAKTLGFTKKELVGSSIFAHTEGLEESRFGELLKDVTTRNVSSREQVEFEYAKNRHGYFDVRMELIPYGVLILALNQTEQVVMRRRLEETNERYSIIINATSDAIWDWDLIANHVRFGDGYRQMFGYDVVERFDFSNVVLDRIHPGDKDRIYHTFLGFIESDVENFEIQYRFLKQDGDFVHIFDRGRIIRDQQGKAIRVVGAKRDITEQVKMDLKEELLRTISRQFLENKTITSALNAILKEVVTITDFFECAEVWLLNAEQTSIDLSATHCTIPECEDLREQSNGIHHCKKGIYLAGKIWEDGVWNYWHAENDENKGGFVPFKVLKSAVGFPMYSDNELIGVLVLGSSSRFEKEQIDPKFIQKITNAFGPEIKRKQLELELEQVFLAAPDIICLADFNGFFKKINPKICELTGYSEEELLSVPFGNFVHPDDKHILYQELIKHEQGVRNLTFENRCIAKDGRVLWLSWSASPSIKDGLIYAVAKDITEKKELEELLRKVNELAQIGGFEIDLTTGNVVWTEITQSILEEKKSTKKKLESAMEYVRSEAERDRVGLLLHKAIYEGKAFDTELEIITGKGNVRWVRVMCESEARNGVTQRLLGSIQNISNKKEAELQLQKMNSELEFKAKKLLVSNAELEQFAYIASHDLQEPLRMITSFLAQLEKKYTSILDDKGKQYIYFAVDGAKRMRQIILDLLEYSRVGREDETVEELNVNEIVQDVLILNRKWIEEVEANVILEPLPAIVAKATPIRQLFQNLISNSLKYRDVNRKPEIIIGAFDRESYWEFIIKDNGIGIDPVYHDKIFQLFQRLHKKEDYSGTGIGLALCKKIMDELNGEIWLEDSSEEGATFCFSIPKMI